MTTTSSLSTKSWKAFQKIFSQSQILLLAMALFTSSISFAQVGKNGASALESLNDDQAKEMWAYTLGMQAYVFGLPVVIFEREYALRTNAEKIERIKDICPCAMVNNLGHKTNLATAADVMPYTPNNDTVYSGALLEYADEPVILSLPDIDDRYWSVEVANPYTENQFYIGSRATDGKGGHHAFISPSWKGTLPEGVIAHRMKYNASMIAVRIGVIPGDEADLKAVNALQKQAYITPLSNFHNPETHGVSPLPESLVLPRPEYTGDLDFFHLMADLMIQHPPQSQHAGMYKAFEKIGLKVGMPFNEKGLDSATRKGLARALQDGEKVMRWKVKFRGTPYANSWNNLHEGTYNYNYFDRAAGALEGLFVHDREEAVYFSTYENDQGVFLDGSNKYVMHFDKDEIPPVLKNGFWSLTMYGRNFQLVKNDIDRFSIGDRTPGLQYNKDGSLDVYIQSTAPEGKASNWLPSPPEGLFRVNYRIYLPQESARNPETLAQYLPGISITQ